MKPQLSCPLAAFFGFGLLSFSAVASGAPPRLDPALSDHAVIQRDRPVVVNGDAGAGDAVTVTLGQERKAVTADRQGRFSARFSPIATPGPVSLSVENADGRTVARDTLVGDVFLCSGQSNMEMEVKLAQNSGAAGVPADDQLRLMTIEKRIADAPQIRFATSPSWAVASRDAVQNFSASCYYMAREWRASAKVPVGAIASSWGGSQISPWMGEKAQATVGRADQSALLALHARNVAAGEQAASAAWEKWWRDETGDKAGREPWQQGSTVAWVPVPRVGPWESWGVPALADYNGMLWFRRDIVLTAQQAAQGATVNLGTLDDVGRLWINGTGVGMSAQAWKPNSFAIPAGVLRAGRNSLTLNVSDGYQNGGMLGPADAINIVFADGGSVPMADGWTYAMAAATQSSAPRVPWSDLAGAGTMYNAMIAPLGEIGLKGVAWYQGESDTGIPGYAGRMTALMADWRRQFATPDLAFVAVQLAGYDRPATVPSESGWANVRYDAYRASLADGHAGLATAIDLGDPYDIHPGEKQEVGRRLARAMRGAVEGDRGAALGPQIVSATSDSAGAISLRFTGVTGGLHLRSSNVAIGFELCGTQPGSCRYASARLDGGRLVLAGDGAPTTRVRYAWADYPVVNLYDGMSLPIGPFEIAVTPQH
ncbi:MAG: sialate O-acetylesterase [Pseudomonadota bacterium]